MKLWKFLSLLLLLTLVLTACVPMAAAQAPFISAKIKLDAPVFEATAQPTAAVAQPTLAATPVPGNGSGPYGPGEDDFPANINPLTGLPVSDPSALNLPAVLVSLSNFPPSVRPQTGLSFAPQVYEIYITVGMTRFLTVFYGDYPQVSNPLTGDKPVREGVLNVQGILIGDRVWFDANKNGLQDGQEVGVGGVEVILRDGSGAELSRVITDGNGFYAFGGETGKKYQLEFVKPSKYSFTSANAGTQDTLDSDADVTSGKTDVFTLTEETRIWDAGLVQAQGGLAATETPAAGTSAVTSPTTEPIVIPTQADEINGVRSGRQAYAPILSSFPYGCLVAGSKSKNVQVRICQNVFEKDASNINSAGLSVNRLHELAVVNQDPNKPVNYSGNLFDSKVPANGADASQVNVYYSMLNQSRWMYDPAAGAYMRYEDYGSEKMVGQFKQSTDRLTGTPLYFENVVVLFVEHTVVAPTILDLQMMGANEKAIVFRDGKVYDNLRWSMRNGEYERKTGMMRPLRIENKDGSPFALKPGHTWFLVATPFSTVKGAGAGIWNYHYFAPKGAK